MWNRFLAGVASNPHMTKKEVCHHLGLKVGTINSIQQHYKLQSPFYFIKPKAYRKKGAARGSLSADKQESESDKSLVDQPDNNTRSSNVYETSVAKSKAKNKKGFKGGGGTAQQSSLSATYDFEKNIQ
jgi:hypothetical protein